MAENIKSTIKIEIVDDGISVALNGGFSVMDAAQIINSLTEAFSEALGCPKHKIVEMELAVAMAALHEKASEGEDHE